MTDEKRDALANWFEQVRFKRQLIGGVDERDVWKKLEALQALYRQIEAEQKAAYEALLADRDERIRELEAEHGETI